MSTLDELQLFFASLTNGAAPLQSLPKEYPAYAIRTLDGYGVAIEWDSNRPDRSISRVLILFLIKQLLADLQRHSLC